MKMQKRIGIMFLVIAIIIFFTGCELDLGDYYIECDDDGSCTEHYSSDESSNDSNEVENENSNTGTEETSSSSQTQAIHPAIDPSGAGKALADYALNLYTYRNKDFKYISPSTTNADKYRVNTYNNVKSEGYLYTDCNGFVSYVIHMSLELGPKTATSVSQIKFAYPSGNEWKSNNSKVKVIAKGLTLSEALAQAQVGDLLGSTGDSTHIQIYIGNGQVIDNTLSGVGSIALRGKGASRSILHQKATFTILRVQL